MPCAFVGSPLPDRARPSAQDGILTYAFTPAATCGRALVYAELEFLQKLNDTVNFKTHQGVA